MNAGVFVAGEADEADLALLFGFDGGLEAAFFDDVFGVVVVVALVKLPEVDHIGAEAPQAVFEVLHGAGVISIANLGHEEGFLTVAIHGEGLAHYFFSTAVVVVPGIVHEGDAVVDGGMNEMEGVLFILGAGLVVAAEAEDRDLHAGLAERARGYAGGGVLSSQRTSQRQCCCAGDEIPSRIVHVERRLLFNGDCMLIWCIGAEALGRTDRIKY